MNYKIICENSEIELTGYMPALTFLDDGNRNFYRVDNDIVEIFYLDELNQKDISKFNGKKTIMLLTKVDEKKISIIKEIEKNGNIIIAIGKRSINDVFQNIIYISSLCTKDKIDIRTLLKIFTDDDLIVKIKNRKNECLSVIGMNDLSNPIGNITLNILKNFAYVQSCNNYNLYIYSKDEFDLQDISYLEDAIKEYIEMNINLTIIQNNSNDENGFVYHLLIGEKVSEALK
ncbi:MAG: hypothetical protein RR620_02920 [Clostridium sp.]